MYTTFLTIESFVKPIEYGGKAYWLSWLYQNGYKVPHSVFLPALERDEFKSIFRDQSNLLHLKKLLASFLDNNKYKVAVRSSATCEDDYHSSLAGHFKTVLGSMTFEEILESINEVVDSLYNAPVPEFSRMGVIVQRLVDASFSGVAFSSNPVSGAKFQSIVSVVPSMGAALVSGQISGEDILVYSSEESFEIPVYSTNISKDRIEELCRIAKKIEKTLNYPVDLEWCIEKSTDTLYILQCRPATGIFYQGDPIMQITKANEKKIPKFVAKNTKVTIRLVGEEQNVHVSNAFIVSVDFTKDSLAIPNLAEIQPALECQGYSTVLIYPQKISGKVIRYFTGRAATSKVEFTDRGRYTIKSEPEYKLLKYSIAKILEKCYKDYWTAVIIVQEVYNPSYTGVLRKISDGYMIEVSRGHFIPKGVVPMSQYVVGFNKELKYSYEVNQDNCFRIFDGYIVEEKLDPKDTLVKISQQTLDKIVQYFKPFLRDEQTTVEFGLLENHNDRTLHPYLIDLVQDKGSSEIDIKSISEGVISKGSIIGKLVIWNPNDQAENPLDLHFYDTVEQNLNQKDSLIYVCNRPDISLLKVIEKHDPQKLGFIFKEGSVLCHLAVVLREKGIPAIVVKDFLDLKQGVKLEIDATTPGLTRKERVRKHD